MDVFPKFIIEDGALILQKCTFHNQIVENSINCVRGGWFKFDSGERSFTLYGRSDDFGQASFADISKCVENKEVYSHSLKHINISNDYKFYYQFDDGTKVKLN